MSERTTIGGTVYETVGSSTSNLLLKCNGTARIQWGNKLIDLIKNGKIASSDSQQMIFTISDEADVKSDGIYILTTEEQDKLLLSKDGNIYNLTEFDLYISASKQQDLTVDQKNQALFNIGMFYDSLDDVKKSNIKNGVVYIIKEKTFYTIRDGIIEEFEAKIKTVEVEKQETEETINSSVKIILSIADKEYLVLADERITANHSIHVKESAQIGSESANQSHGYRLYMEGGTSYLDVDEINVRNGLPSQEYKEVTYEELKTLMLFKTLKPHQWYLITDFQNHWKLPIHNLSFNRPILIRALTNSTFYEEGELFKDRRVKIHYDPSYEKVINQLIIDELTLKTTRQDIYTRGRITWMKDAYGNEANFDFLDYIDCEGNPLTTLHDSVEDPEYLDKSIFPKHSYNNKIEVITSVDENDEEFLNLYGTVIGDITVTVKEIQKETQTINGVQQEVEVEKEVEKEVKGIVNENTDIIEFLFNDSGENKMIMHDNNIKCFSLTLPDTCLEFYNNTVVYDSNLYEDDDYTTQIKYFNIYKEQDSKISNSSFVNVFGSIIGRIIDGCEFINSINIKVLPENSLINTKFEKLKKCIISGTISDSYFYDLKYYTTEGFEITYECEYDWNADVNRKNLTLTLSDNTNLKSTITNSNLSNIINTTFSKDCILNGVVIQKSELSKFTKGELKNSKFTHIKKCDFNILKEFSGNTINLIENQILNNQTIINSSFNTLNQNFQNKEVTFENCTFNDFYENTFEDNLTKFSHSTFNDVTKCTFTNVQFYKTSFKNLQHCIIGAGSLENITGHTDITDNTTIQVSINNTLYPLLYDSTKIKEVYCYGGVLSVTLIKEGTFFRGMIVMHSGGITIPEGWAICDGRTVVFDGVQTTTPDLRNRFIKVADTPTPNKNEDGLSNGHDSLNYNQYVGAFDNEDLDENNSFTLTEDHLPSHTHPHTHSFSNDQSSVNFTIDTVSVGDEKQAIIEVEGGTPGISGYDISEKQTDVEGSVAFSGTTSEEITSDKTWTNKSIKIEPNYYSLIFIIKL